MEKEAFVSRVLTDLEEFVAKFVRLATIELGDIQWAYKFEKTDPAL